MRRDLRRGRGRGRPCRDGDSGLRRLRPVRGDGRAPDLRHGAGRSVPFRALRHDGAHDLRHALRRGGAHDRAPRRGDVRAFHLRRAHGSSGARRARGRGLRCDANSSPPSYRRACRRDAGRPPRPPRP